jgi:hypothetical protein
MVNFSPTNGVLSETVGASLPAPHALSISANSAATTARTDRFMTSDPTLRS